MKHLRDFTLLFLLVSFLKPIQAQTGWLAEPTADIGCDYDMLINRAKNDSLVLLKIVPRDCYHSFDFLLDLSNPYFDERLYSGRTEYTILVDKKEIFSGLLNSGYSNLQLVNINDVLPELQGENLTISIKNRYLQFSHDFSNKNVNVLKEVMNDYKEGVLNEINNQTFVFRNLDHAIINKENAVELDLWHPYYKEFNEKVGELRGAIKRLKLVFPFHSRNPSNLSKWNYSALSNFTLEKLEIENFESFDQSGLGQLYEVKELILKGSFFEIPNEISQIKNLDKLKVLTTRGPFWADEDSSNFNPKAQEKIKGWFPNTVVIFGEWKH